MSGGCSGRFRLAVLRPPPWLAFLSRRGSAAAGGGDCATLYYAPHCTLHTPQLALNACNHTGILHERVQPTATSATEERHSLDDACAAEGVDANARSAAEASASAMRAVGFAARPAPSPSRSNSAAMPVALSRGAGACRSPSCTLMAALPSSSSTPHAPSLFMSQAGRVLLPG